MPARYELHGIWLSGPTYKVALMLALSGEAFDYVHTGPRDRAKTPEFMKMQRWGQVPLLVDRVHGLNLSQSAAIIDHLADDLGTFGGKDGHERIEAREWMFWEFDRLAMHVYRLRGQRLGLRSISQPIAEMHHGEGNAALKILDGHLAGRGWLVGAGPTIADIDMYGVVHYAPAGGYDLAAYPNVSAWKGRFESLPGYGAPDKLMPKG